MIKNNKILCVIQARGGSKGIPNKNIYKLNEHPLISYSIAAAKKAKYIDDIIVSTDSIKIAKVANEYGVATPFLRPKSLATDKTPSVDSLFFALKKTEKIYKKTYDYIIELPCVAPLRDHNDVNKSIEIIHKKKSDSVIGYVDTGEKHPLRLKKIRNNKMTNFCKEYPETERSSFRQSFEPSYIRNGSIYLMSRKCLLKKSRIGKNSIPFIMPQEKSINIDEKFDLLTAKHLIENGFCKNLPKKIILQKKNISTKKNILVSTPVHFMKNIIKDFDKLGETHYCHGANSKEIKNLIKNVNIWICSPSPDYYIDENILKHAKKLNYIITPSTGSNHISHKDCKKLKIKIKSIKKTKNIKQISASSEFTFSLMLNLVRKINKAENIVRSGHWRNMEDHLRSIELKHKNVGIVGFGRIGSNLARYCKAFHMNIFAYEPNFKIKSKFVNQCSDVKKLLSSSDIIFICVHLDDSTKMMVNKTWFNQMTRKPFFINTSRGEIIDEKSLINALKNNKIKGAAIDVLSNEQNILSKGHKLVEYQKNNDNLIITPHIAGLTVDSELKAAKEVIKIIKKL